MFRIFKQAIVFKDVNAEFKIPRLMAVRVQVPPRVPGNENTE